MFQLALSSSVRLTSAACINSDSPTTAGPPGSLPFLPAVAGAKPPMVVRLDLSPPAAYRPKEVKIKTIKYPRAVCRDGVS